MENNRTSLIILILGATALISTTGWFISEQRRFREPTPSESVSLPTTILKPASESISQDISERLLQLGWDNDQADEVMQKVRASTVCLMAHAASEHCDATAVVVGPDLLATCGHCAHGHEEERETKTLFIRTIGGIKMDAKVLAIHPSTDLGLVQVVSNKETLPPPLVIGFASPGEAVVVVGHPSGIGTWVVKAGKILSVDSWGKGGYLADFSSEGGMSGSPVVNKRGELIGILSGSTDSELPGNPKPATIESGTILRDLIEHNK